MMPSEVAQENVSDSLLLLPTFVPNRSLCTLWALSICCSLTILVKGDDQKMSELSNPHPKSTGFHETLAMYHIPCNLFHSEKNVFVLSVVNLSLASLINPPFV